jgi:hypothetical protein
MKLKKAMKLYSIEKGKPNEFGITVYRLNGKSIWPSRGTGPLWCTFGQENIPERDAVAWLIEGAERKIGETSLQTECVTSLIIDNKQYVMTIERVVKI